MVNGQGHHRLTAQSAGRIKQAAPAPIVPTGGIVQQTDDHADRNMVLRQAGADRLQRVVMEAAQLPPVLECVRHTTDGTGDVR
jgi:hypothetical protein